MLKDYYRLTKPGIVYGNVMAAAAGFLLASRWHIHAGLLVATLVGTALVIASACVFNNFIDRGIDSKMSRTKKRALVTESIPGAYAIIYAATLGIFGFLILILFTNWLVVALGALAIFFYVVVYGIAKRRSIYGTLVGAIPGAIPPAAGYVAVTNHLNGGALLLFLIFVCWQMPHFYAIAMFRRGDYAAAGIPVLPVVKGMRRTKVEILFYTAAFILVVVLLSVFGYTGYIFAVVMAALGLYWLLRGIKGFGTRDDVKWGRGMFGLSLIVLLSLCAMLAVGPVLP